MNQIVVNLIYIPYVLCLEFHNPNPDVTVETWDFFWGARNLSKLHDIGATKGEFAGLELSKKREDGISLLGPQLSS